jgi:AcrR family transcriptional regulator
VGIKERKEREKALRRRQIQDAAKEVFIEKGFVSANIEDIANKAELSPGTIYQYFRNKEDLYTSLLLISLKYFYEQIEAVYLEENLSVEEKFIGFKEAMYNTLKYDQILLRIIFHLYVEDTLNNLGKDLLSEMNDLTRRLFRMMADVYDQGVVEGKFSEGNSIARADITWAIFTGVVIYEGAKRKIDPKKDFLKQTLDDAFNIFLKGIRSE